MPILKVTDSMDSNRVELFSFQPSDTADDMLGTYSCYIKWNTPGLIKLNLETILKNFYTPDWKKYQVQDIKVRREAESSNPECWVSIEVRNCTLSTIAAAILDDPSKPIPKRIELKVIFVKKETHAVRVFVSWETLCLNYLDYSSSLYWFNFFDLCCRSKYFLCIYILNKRLMHLKFNLINRPLSGTRPRINLRIVSICPAEHAGLDPVAYWFANVFHGSKV